MGKTLNEGFSEILNDVRRLNVEATSVQSEMQLNSQITQQKLRHLLTLNADTYDDIQSNSGLAGLKQYASDQLGILDIAATATNTKAAILGFRDYMKTNLPAPADNGLDANGRSTNLIVTAAQMPDLINQLGNLITNTNWA